MVSHAMRIYGAWLYRGVWDGHTPPPESDCELLRMKPGRYAEAPEGFTPQAGQFTILGQGDHMLLVTP